MGTASSSLAAPVPICCAANARQRMRTRFEPAESLHLFATHTLSMGTASSSLAPAVPSVMSKSNSGGSTKLTCRCCVIRRARVHDGACSSCCQADCHAVQAIETARHMGHTC